MAGASIPFALNNANKRSCGARPGQTRADRDRLIELAGDADIVVDSGNPGRAAAFGTSCAALSERYRASGRVVGHRFRRRRPARVVAGYRSGALCHVDGAVAIGPTTGRPVLPPNGIASATAAVQAAWAALAAYYHRLRYGTGDYIDFSRFEAVVQSLDPPFGSEGQAAVGLKRSSELWRGRPRNQQIYPIFACRDGHVRICLLSPRQWRGMRAWLGEPEQFADPKFDTIAARYAASREINALIAELFADADDGRAGDGGAVAGSADRRGAQPGGNVGLRALSVRRGADRRPTIAPGVDVTVPVGAFVVDGSQSGYARPAPSVGCTTKPHGAHRDPQRPTSPGSHEREAAVRRPADSRSRRDRRGRRTRPAVRRPRRRGRSRSRAPPIPTGCVRRRRAR